MKKQSKVIAGILAILIIGLVVVIVSNLNNRPKLIKPIIGCESGALFNTVTGKSCGSDAVQDGCVKGAHFDVFSGKECPATTTYAGN